LSVWITNNKKQKNSKYQLSKLVRPYGWMDDRNCFGYWIFEYCNLFEIWCLSFV